MLTSDERRNLITVLPYDSPYAFRQHPRDILIKTAARNVRSNPVMS